MRVVRIEVLDTQKDVADTLQAIMAPDHQPTLDPADMALLATPEQLRNASGKASNVSFLRRTQYISAAAGRRAENMLMTTPMRPKPVKLQQEREVLSKDDPVYIKRFIQKGFDVAYPDSKAAAEQADPTTKGMPASYADVEAWRHPVHPDNPKLKPVEFFPLLPDLESYPEHGGYTSLKFDKPPLPATENGKRDERVDVGLLQAAHDPDALPAWQARSKAYESNPDVYDHPGEVPLNLALHLPKDSADVPRIRSVFNSAHPAKDSNPTVDGQPEQFSYSRQRLYQIVNSTTVQDNVYRSIALSLFDPGSSSLTESRLKSQPGQKAAYYYPVHQVMKLRAKPPSTNPRKQGEETQGVSDAVTLMVHEPDEEKIKARSYFHAQVDSKYKKEYDEKYPKEPTPEPEPEPIPPPTNGTSAVEGDAGDDDDDDDDDDDGDVKMTGNDDRGSGREDSRGSHLNGNEDVDAEGEFESD